MPITKSMVQKAKRERAAADAQAAAQKPEPSRKRQRETDNAAEREEKGSFQTPIRETRSQTRKRQAQESEVGSSRQATPPKRRQPGQRSKASRRRTAPPSSGPISRSKGSLSYAEPEPRQTAPSTSLQAVRSTTHNHGESIRTVSTEKPAPSDIKHSTSRGDQKRKDKGNLSVYPAHHDENRSQVLAGQTTAAMTSQQIVQDRFDISAATSQIANLFPQFYGRGVPTASSYAPSFTRSSTLISTECGTETSNATTSETTEGSQYVPNSESQSTDPTFIQPSAVSEATDIQPGAASDTTVTPATYCRRRKTTWKDRARLRKEAQKKAKDELKANTGYGVGTKTTAFLHWIPVPSDRRYLQKIESALWRRNSMKGERGKGRGYRDAWWWHFANHYKIQAENVSCELDYSELMRASAEASAFSNKPGLMDMGVPTCDRCFFMGRACRTDQINACINCVKAFQPCTMTERKHPFTRRQFTGQRWINHGYDINFNIIKKRTDDPHKLFCDWEDVPLPPPPRTGELVYLRGRSLERPDPEQPKAVPCLPFDRAYQVPDRIYEKYNLHEIDWPWPLPDPFPEGDEEPTGETPEERQRRLATKAEVEEKRVRYNMRQQERRQGTGNEELPGTREKRVYSIEWQKARQKQMMADYHQRTRHMKESKRSTRGRSRTQSRATASMAEARPDEQLEQQVQEQLQNELEQQTEHPPQKAQQQTHQQLQYTLQQQIQYQQPSQSQTEVAVQHENDTEMADSISQVQATTNQETRDSILAQANNPMPPHSSIPIDPILERMQFYNSLLPGRFQTNTRCRSSLQTTTYESVQALGNTRRQAPAQDGREIRDRTKMLGCGKQERRAATNENEGTNERTVQAIQPDPNTVAGYKYQVLQQAAGAASSKPLAASTSRIPSSTAQASWDSPYPDPPAKDTDAFGYYAIARVEAAPENLFGYPVIPVPNSSIYRPPEEAQNEWHISDPKTPKTHTESPGPVPAYPTFTTRNAQQHNKEQNDGGSGDVEMSGF
ncbi:uncharacterized protein BDW70DRAFT_170428 [Aspergillus foveolatus]|uniref:uncharacterized protein n=1 Tax=Aspergillus foveolatus TaxID=210207 RepID=UPI003CCE49A8